MRRGGGGDALWGGVTLSGVGVGVGVWVGATDPELRTHYLIICNLDMSAGVGCLGCVCSDSNQDLGRVG